ncbi:MAG: hypothetical protein LBJ31_07685 [Treponema sp.]|jgi:hypothetical protein|nr:hypothetical protein [Treponema sp.]
MKQGVTIQAGHVIDTKENYLPLADWYYENKSKRNPAGNVLQKMHTKNTFARYIIALYHKEYKNNFPVVSVTADELTEAMFAQDEFATAYFKGLDRAYQNLYREKSKTNLICRVDYYDPEPEPELELEPEFESESNPEPEPDGK